MALDRPHYSHGRHNVCVPAKSPSRAIERVGRGLVVSTVAAHTKEAGAQSNCMAEVWNWPPVGWVQKSGGRPRLLDHYLTQ